MPRNTTSLADQMMGTERLDNETCHLAQQHPDLDPPPDLGRAAGEHGNTPTTVESAVASMETVSTTMERLSLAKHTEISFIHQSLDLTTKSIRLIRVHPIRSDGTISCTMKHSDPEGWRARLPKEGLRWPRLEEPYTCLSYVWGSEEDQRDILINNQHLRVRKNLFDFLDVVARTTQVEATDLELGRHPSWDDDEPGLFESWWWIDALCIDQHNTVEKNQLVQRMGKIYFAASNVVSWMGNEPHIASLFRRANTYEPLRKAEVDDFSVAVKELESSTYWTRAWIVQETFLPNNLTLLAQDVATSMGLLQNLVSGKHGMAKWSTIHQILENHAPSRCSADKLGQELPTPAGSLIQNMWRFRDRGCFDRRDRAYSVISISWTDSSPMVDYNRTLVELARAVLEAAKGGICLCRAYIVLHALQLDQDKLTSDHHIPFIDIQGSRGIVRSRQFRPPIQCCQCLRRLNPASVSNGVHFSRDSTFIFCLSCEHSTLPRSDPEIKIKQSFGHLVLLLKHEASGDSDRLFWLSPPGGPQRDGRWVEIHEPGLQFERNDDRVFLTLSVAMVRKLISLNHRKDFHFTAEQIGIVAPGGYHASRKPKGAVWRAAKEIVWKPRSDLG